MLFQGSMLVSTPSKSALMVSEKLWLLGNTRVVTNRPAARTGYLAARSLSACHGSTATTSLCYLRIPKSRRLKSTAPNSSQEPFGSNSMPMHDERFDRSFIQPIRLFDHADSDNDGLLTKHEFQSALEAVLQESAAKNQEAAKGELLRLTKKMETLERLENQIGCLEESYEVHPEGGRASDIDIERQKNDIQTTIAELKSLIYGARAVFNTVAVPTKK